MLTPLSLDVATSLVTNSSQTALVVATKAGLDVDAVSKPKRLSPEIMRVAVLRAPVNSGNLWLSVDVQEVAECTIRLVAHQYSKVSADGSNFMIGSQIAVPLEKNGTVMEDFSIVFQQENLTRLALSLNDYWGIVKFFSSDVITGNITYNASGAIQPSVRAMLIEGDVASKVDAITESMTKYVRSGPGSQPFTGMRIVNTVFVRVHWAWLILPLVEIAAAVTLLLWTISLSASAGNLELLKSSSLALLFAEYQSQDGLLRPSPVGREQIEREARTRQAQVL